MKDVIFHSLYADPGFHALKHAIFYFGKVYVPAADFVFLLQDPVSGQIGEAITGGNVAYADHVNPIPEHLYPHLEFLEKEGCVEQLNVPPDEADPRQLYELIVEQGNRSNRQRIYRPGDVAPLFSFLRLNPDHEEAHQSVEQLAVMVVAQCLRGVALGRGLPCVDNLFIYDLVNLGLRGIFESFLEKEDFSEEEVRSLKAQYLGQAVTSLFLPSFTFRSFDDVLELREHFKDRLIALQARLLEAGAELEGMPWEESFQASLVRKIEDEIVPEIGEFRKAARFSPKNIAREMATAGAVVALQTLVPDFVADWLIGGGAVSLFDAVKKERERVQKVRLESSFSVLLQIPR